MPAAVSALAIAALLAAACSGGSDASDSAGDVVAEQPAVESDDGQAGARAAGAASGAAEPEATPAAPAADPVPAATPAGPGGRGVIAGLDTSIRSVELEQIEFDLFNGSNVSLAEAPESTILALVDVIPPLDANRALLDETTAARVGEVRYTGAAEAGYLLDERLVLGYIADDGQPYAFPISILNFHEIVNDTLGGRAVLISYCPLCRSGVVYERVVDGQLLSFGNSSALFQSDVVMFDRQTNSYWFQTAGEAVIGTLTGKRLPLLPSSLIPWGTWLAEHPDTLVLSMNTGFTRNYLADPFDGYESAVNAGRLPFSVDEDVLADDRLPLDELVLGLEVGETARAYPLNTLGDTAVNDEIAGQAVVIFSSANGPAGNAFDPHLDGQRLSFRYDDGAYRDDETGSLWSLGGRALAGPLSGAQLTALPSRTTFWFSYRSAFPDVEVFEIGFS